MISAIFTLLAETTPAPSSPGLFGSPFVPIVLMLAIAYFMLIRPQQTRQKAIDSLQTSLKTGDKVVTSSGIHGIIANVKEGKTLILKIADNVKIEIDKSSISAVEKTPDSAPAIAAS